MSVIIPLLNEAENLPALFRTLAAQKDVRFEVIFSDGGSTDGTCTLLDSAIPTVPFPCRVVTGEKGRGRQFNSGVKVSRGANLLFLHADSIFPDSLAFRRGLDALVGRDSPTSDERVAGRFSLHFRQEGKQASAAYYFYEWKARLDRPECVHGDQGILISRPFWGEVGPCDESLPFLEDVALAGAVLKIGKWRLLPDEIHTSARRFEAEGLLERQLLNALIMNFFAIGWLGALREIPGIYSSQDRVGKLRLLPLFKKIGSLLRDLPARERFSLWYRTGCYVRANAWQLAFALDARRCFRQGLAPGEGRASALAAFDRFFDPVTDNPPGRLAGAAVVRLWFSLAKVWRALVEA
ncbi:MAG: TIGR04283 family arsenosugar biosynthesis glycosyltransferase [Desulfuromonadales bacterium]